MKKVKLVYTGLQEAGLLAIWLSLVIMFTATQPNPYIVLAVVVGMMVCGLWMFHAGKPEVVIE